MMTVGNSSLNYCNFRPPKYSPSVSCEPTFLSAMAAALRTNISDGRPLPTKKRWREQAFLPSSPHCLVSLSSFSLSPT